MRHLKQSNWARRRIGEHEINNVLSDDWLGLKCWRVGKYLGSMLYMDFGARISVPARNSVVEAGEATLGIRDCYWTILNYGKEVIDSDTVDESWIPQLSTVFVGSELSRVALSASSQEVVLSFSAHCEIRVDASNRYGTTEAILEFVSPNGHIHQVEPSGDIVLSDQVSAARCKH
jgi:hypothetical protein